MFDWLFELLESNPSYPYVLVGCVFVLCGIGLPLPEEIVLILAGYLCYAGQASYWLMAAVCAGSILVGDLIPFMLGNLFGPRLLRLRMVRWIVNKQRLAEFDRWFRRRGDMVILIARFIPGLRVVAFFTAGTMRMRSLRFLVLDVCGIMVTAPTFVWVGWHFGSTIQEAIAFVHQVERSILILGGVLGAGLALWYWLRKQARGKLLIAGPRETFVEPRRRPSEIGLPAPQAPETAATPPPPDGDAAAEPDANTASDAPQERGPDPH